MCDENNRAIVGQRSDAPECLIHNKKDDSSLTFEQIKEIADRYGIGVKEVSEGEGGFIIDDTGIVYKQLPTEILDRILRFEDC